MERMRIGFWMDHASRNPWVLGFVVGLAMAVSSAWPVPALGQAPRPGDPDASKASLARFLPRQNLIAYLECDGLDAHGDAWKKSVAYKLLNDTKLGALLEDLARQGFELMRQSAGGDSPVTAADMIDLVKHVARHGGAVGVWGKPNDPDGGGPGIVFVARGGDRPSIRHMLEDAASRNLAGRGRPGADRTPVQKAGRTYHPIDQKGGWWFEKGDLILSNRPDFVMSVLDGKEPNALDHPLRVALFQAKEGFQPVAAGFVNITAVPPMPPQAVQLGLDGLKRIEFQWGLQDDALVAVLGAVAPAPRRGILAFLDQPTFNIQSLPPLPAGLTGFAVLSLDFARIYDKVVELANQSNPQMADGFAQIEAAFHQQFGIALRNDLLASLGPKISVYSQAANADPAADPALAALAPFSGLTISAQIRGDSLAKVIDPLIQTINQIIQAQQAGARRGPPDPNARAIAFRKQDDPRPTYMLDLPQGGLPPQILAMFQPTIRLGKDQLVVAATTPNAVRAVDLAGAAPDQLWRPTGAFIPMARRLPGDLVFLNVSDPRDTLPQLVQSLPGVVQQVNMLLPAVQSARGAARRAQCSNNLKQIALAMHNYHGAFNNLPKPAIIDKDGKPLLSWRIAILPYIDQGPLYNRFKLDEPWDSPNNKELIKEMPLVFVCPEQTKLEPFTTTYRVFTGPGALFEKGKDTGFAGVTDGTSSTFMVVEAKESVPWTKPDAELEFDPAAVASLYGTEGPHNDGFNAAFADGAVRFLPNSINANLFHDFVTRNGGEVIDPSRFPDPPRPRDEAVARGPLHVDPTQIPQADELKSLLFPGSLAIVSDANGARIVSRESFPSVSSPAVSGVLIALLLPAVQSAREAARRAQCTNNLKQMGLGMLNYESATSAFPKPALTDKDGKPLLSWRVAILPYIEQAELYNRFHLDEPWDSPHNKELIKEMPTTFVCPSRPNLEPGTTTYRIFVGEGALFEKGKDTRIAQITDGTSNTIMICESNEAVPWTKPDAELPFDPEAKPSFFGAGSVHPGGFNALFADGSARFIKITIDLNVFKALITRAGGEVVNREGQ